MEIPSTPLAGAAALPAKRSAASATGLSSGDAEAVRQASHLTEGDRAFLRQTTGDTFEGDVPLMSGVAWQIAFDRMSGVLAAGQPIDADYLRHQASQEVALDSRSAEGSSKRFTDEFLDKALKFLAESGGRARLDTNL